MRRALLVGMIVLVGCCLGEPATGWAGGTPEAEWQKLREQLPATPRKPVEDTYFGTKVVDPYRWLENGSDPEVQQWMKQQDTVAREFLDHIPGEPELAQRIGEILRARTVHWSAPRAAGGKLFVLKTEPPRQQPFLVVCDGPDDVANARVVVDPGRIDTTGHTAINWYRPSPDGSLVAVSLSSSGTEAGDLHFFDVESGKERFETIHHVQNGTAGGDVCWTAHGAGVLYTRYPRPGERDAADMAFYQQIWFHRLGTSVKNDRYELGRDFPRIAETRFVSPSTGQILAIVEEGDSGRFQHYLRSADGRWTQLTKYDDRITGVAFGPDGSLYLISLKDTPRGAILHLPVGATSMAGAKPVVAEQDGSLQWSFYFDVGFVVTTDRLYATYQVGGPIELRTFALPDGSPASGPTAPPISSIAGLRSLGSRGVIFRQTSYTAPMAWYLYDPASGKTHQTAMRSESPVNFDDVVVERHFATSTGDTQVPFVIVMRKGTDLNGSNPVLATAYGGYGISRTPGYDPVLRVWLDAGGVFVEAGVRGGGEYGEEWHREGSGVLKQNTFDDFAAVLKWLVDNHYTRPERLGIIGGSNGGILMGAMITQHPDMEKAVVSLVGVYDMLRNELTPNGQFNVPEYGSIKVEKQFRALYAYSPYHHVAPDTRYPAVLLTAGANDPRVNPMNSRKFAARLQAASTSGEPVLLRVDYSGGHGVDASLNQRISLTAHINAFLMDELGMLGAEPEAAR